MTTTSTGALDADSAAEKLYAQFTISDPNRRLTLLPDPPPRQAWCPIISADDHVLEPPTLFTDRLPASMLDDAPHTPEIAGRAYWVVDGELIHINSSNGAVGGTVTELMQAALRFDEMRP